jgi:heparinase II/III-like protein
VVMRSGWGREDHQLLFDVGPLGCSRSGGHGHADLLSVQCAAFGEPCLVDAGTGSYVGAWRNVFRLGRAHSSVIVDGQSQAAAAGPFRWTSRPHARLRRWRSNSQHDIAVADHDAYRSLPDPVTHRRSVVFVKPRYWLVVDDLEGAAAHRVDVCFQFGAVMLDEGRGSWLRATGSGGRGIAIRAWSSAPLRRSIAVGQTDPPVGWISAEYGQRQPAPALTYSVTAQLPLRIATVIVPIDSDAVALPTPSELLSCVALLES